MKEFAFDGWVISDNRWKEKFKDATAGQGINGMDGENLHSSLLVASIFPVKKESN